MSIAELDVIDGMGISKDDRKTLILLLSDHLIWDDEEAHIWALEDKINAYASYIETKQYKKVYPENDFEQFAIYVCFLHQYPDSCLSFFTTLQKQLEPLKITLYATMETM